MICCLRFTIDALSGWLEIPLLLYPFFPLSPSLFQNFSDHPAMPVSHLGLTVSDLPSATTFYLATLAPLGYRYIASRGGDVGLGIHEADFFLRQAEQGCVLQRSQLIAATNQKQDASYTDACRLCGKYSRHSAQLLHSSAECWRQSLRPTKLPRPRLRLFQRCSHRLRRQHRRIHLKRVARTRGIPSSSSPNYTSRRL